MTGFTDRVSQVILNHITVKTGIFTLPTSYVALFTVAGNDAGTGFTEVTTSGTGYTRRSTAAADWNAASGSGPSQISNAATLTFPSATADWGSIIAFGIYDASSAGNLLAWDYFGSFVWMPATVSAAAPAVITAHAHGIAVGELVQWTNEYGGTLPSFTQSNFIGTLTATSPTTDTFTVTNAATAVNTSATGNGMLRKLVPQSITTGSSAAFPSGALVITSS
jgi:hypothetical protein